MQKLKKNPNIYFLFLFLFGCAGSLLHQFSLVAGLGRGYYSSLQRTGFWLWCLLLLRSAGSRTCRLWSFALPALAHRLRLSGCGAWVQLLLGLWNLPGPGIALLSLALQGGFLATGPPGKPQTIHFKMANFKRKIGVKKGKRKYEIQDSGYFSFGEKEGNGDEEQHKGRCKLLTFHLSCWVAASWVLTILCFIDNIFLRMSFKMHCCSVSHVQLFASPQTAACQVSLSFTISWSFAQAHVPLWLRQ